MSAREEAGPAVASTPVVAAPEAEGAGAGGRGAWRARLVRPELVTLLLLVGAVIVSARLSPFFADARFVLESATFYTETAIVALVLTALIVAGEIDLSPAAQMALSACLFGLVVEAGGPVALGALAALASGAAMGALNGVLVLRFRLPSIIVTIGTLTLYRGLAQVIAGDRSLGGFPGWFVGIDYRVVLGVPVPVWIMALVALALGLAMGSTIWGRRIYQVGTSPVAAEHAGIRVNRLKMGLFVLLGVTSAAAGLMAASRLASVRYDLATGAELQMVLTVMLGGTSIFGGRGSVLGTFLAAWLLVIIATGMTVANVPVTSQLIVMGLLLIVALIGTNAIYARAQR